LSATASAVRVLPVPGGPLRSRIRPWPFHALVVLDEGEYQILLFLGINEVVVSLVVPDYRLDVVNVEVEPKLSFQRETPQNGRDEDQIMLPLKHLVLVFCLLLLPKSLDIS
jgi:hypothetical protein